jgi:hypothetical protein
LRLNVFDATGDFDRPSEIAEMSPNLAHHRGDGEGEKFSAVVDVEAVHGTHQADACSLNEIIERFAAAAVAPCDVIGQWQTAIDDHVALTPKGD